MRLKEFAKKFFGGISFLNFTTDFFYCKPLFIQVARNARFTQSGKSAIISL